MTADPTFDDRPAVDGTLIDEMLRLTPAQRLRQNDRMAGLAFQLREAFGVPGADDEDEP